MSQSNVSRHRM